MDSHRQLVVDDSGRGVAIEASWIYLWNGYREDRAASLLQYVERHGERLRWKYLAWIHDLGETRINGQRIIDHLARADGFSDWWTTLFVEKSVYKSDLSSALRLLALDEIVEDLRPAVVCVHSPNARLHAAVKHLCRLRGIKYVGRGRKKGWAIVGTAMIRRLPHLCRGLLKWLQFVVTRWPSGAMPPVHKESNQAAVCFCSYFFNFSETEAEHGRFESRYWTSLPSWLQKTGRAVNWVQLYYRHAAVPNMRRARVLIQCFNRGSGTSAGHQLLDAWLSWSVAWRVLVRWGQLVFKLWQLRKVRPAFQPTGTKVSLWPLLRGDWLDSLSGATAVGNLFYLELFERALRAMPRQEVGLYLCENQGWERAFIHVWRKAGHGRLIGVAHATIRFWDLRYFSDLRSLGRAGAAPLPQPDLMALNGDAAVAAYRAMNFPLEGIVACEALRFGYLRSLRGRVEAGQKRREKTPVTRVLILGDYLRRSTNDMLTLLQEAAEEVGERAVYVMKPHPNCMVDSHDFPRLRFEVRSNALEELLPEFDLAYASNMTSAAVDAYCAGLNVIVVLDNSGLNFSPLRGQRNVSFVGEPRLLAKAILSARSARDDSATMRFFYLDPKLPRWSALLSLQR